MSKGIRSGHWRRARWWFRSSSHCPPTATLMHLRFHRTGQASPTVLSLRRALVALPTGTISLSWTPTGQTSDWCLRIPRLRSDWMGPAWARDGQSLYVTRRGAADPPRIERVRLDGTDRTVIVEHAHSPSAAPDGRLVY